MWRNPTIEELVLYLRYNNSCMFYKYIFFCVSKTYKEVLFKQKKKNDKEVTLNKETRKKVKMHENQKVKCEDKSRPSYILVYLSNVFVTMYSCHPVRSISMQFCLCPSHYHQFYYKRELVRLVIAVLYSCNLLLIYYSNC